MKLFFFIFVFSYLSLADNFLPVQIAARPNMKKSRLEFGLKNISKTNIAGIIFVEHAEGIELLKTDAGFNLLPRKIKYIDFPMRNLKLDAPKLICKTIIFDGENSKIFTQKINCKSGAAFREVGAYNETNIYSSNKIQARQKNKFSLFFSSGKKIIINNFSVFFNGKIVELKKTKNSFCGTVYNKNKQIAKLNLSLQFNSRGACLAVLNYELLDKLSSQSKPPEIKIEIPKKIARDNLLAFKYSTGKTKLSQIKNANKFLRNDVEEFSVITSNGRMTFYLDSIFITGFSEKKESFIFSIRSRGEWRPPFPPRRAGTILFICQYNNILN